MSPVTRHVDLPQRRGEADAHHYKQRVKKKINDHLKEHIGKEDIITSDGKIRVPIKGTKKFRFILDRGKKEGGGGPGQGDVAGTQPGEEEYEVWLNREEMEEMLFADLDLPRLKPKKEGIETSEYKFNTHAVKGPLVDKKETLRRNLIRTQAQNDEDGDFDEDDLRYISYRDTPVPKSKAVVFLMMDVSGSMDDRKKQIARLFYYWTVRFLRFRYDTVEVRFISHTTEAKEQTEHEFFNREESGGTMVSPAYKLAQTLIHQHYPLQDWNIYVLHASDGDNWQMDNEDVFQAIKELTAVCALVGYLEIKPKQQYSWFTSPSTLWDILGERKKELDESFMIQKVRAETDIWSALKHFFHKEDVEGSVR